MLRVVFWGTPEVAVPALHALADDPAIDVVAAVTKPDRPRGRSRQPIPPPVKLVASDLGIGVRQPQRPRELAPVLAGWDLDACAVVAYGAILPTEVLQVARLGFVNLHFSLLPRWRGAAPVQHAIRAGDTVTGITTFVLDAGMDTGPVLERVAVPLDPNASAGEVLTRLAALGAPVLARSIHRLATGEEPTPQPSEGATFAPKIQPQDVRADWTAPATAVVALVRSADPAPGAHTTFRGQRLKLWRAEAAAGDGAPGTVLEAGGGGLIVACGAGAVRLLEVQPAGKARMDAVAFVNGHHPGPGEVLGP